MPAASPDKFEKRLQGLTAGRRRLSAHGSGYTTYIKLARTALPIVALVLVGVVIARLQNDPLRDQIAQLPAQEKAAPGQTELAQARYEGVDEQGQPYRVTAEKVSRADDKQGMLNLEKPQADVMLNSGNWISLIADTGVYLLSMEHLVLKNNVALYHDAGYELHTDMLDVMLKDKIARSYAPVQAQGPIGTLQAHDMTITDSGNLITFGGPATMTLNFKAGAK